MEIVIFAKKRQTKDGKKTFFTYLSTLTRKDGAPVLVSVRFIDPCKAPDPLDCPCNIVVEKEDCNLSKEDYISNSTNEVKTSYKLWVKRYANGTPYVDHSMDDFE